AARARWRARAPRLAVGDPQQQRRRDRRGRSGRDRGDERPARRARELLGVRHRRGDHPRTRRRDVAAPPGRGGDAARAAHAGPTRARRLPRRSAPAQAWSRHGALRVGAAVGVGARHARALRHGRPPHATTSGPGRIGGSRRATGDARVAGARDLSRRAARRIHRVGGRLAHARHAAARGRRSAMKLGAGAVILLGATLARAAAAQDFRDAAPPGAGADALIEYGLPSPAIALAAAAAQTRWWGLPGLETRAVSLVAGYRSWQASVGLAQTGAP